MEQSMYDGKTWKMFFFQYNPFLLKIELAIWRRLRYNGAV